MKQHRIYKYFYYTILLILFLLNSTMLIFMKKNGLVVNFESRQNIDSIISSYNITNEKKETAKNFISNDPVAVLQEVMNLVPKVEHGPGTQFVKLYNHVKKGNGLVCSGMARLYYNVLSLKGYKCRLVYLLRNVGDPYDTHVTVEVFENNKWIIYDPTFNISFIRNGELLSAYDIQKSFLDGTFYSIKTKFYGEVKYPARLPKYYMHWLSLFNNVFIPGAPEKRNLIQKVPPFGYFSRITFYYKEISKHQAKHYSLYNQLNFIFYFLLPGTLLFFTSWYIVIFYSY